MKRAVLAAVLAAAIVSSVAAASGGPSLLHPASLHAKAPATFKARFKTTKGSFVVKVTRRWAPKGADRFYNLVRNRFYDNQPFFRVDPGYVVQWGISMQPRIAKAWQHATIKDDPVARSNVRGTITFAIGGKNSRATQVFVNLGSHASFNKEGFAPFGRITSGLPVFSHLYHGYYDGPTQHQNLLTHYGEPWVRKNYPKLDWIETGRLVHSG